MSRPLCVRAWALAEGDVLQGGACVVSVQRDPAADQVVLGTDDGAQRMLCREDRLIVAHRAPTDDEPGERVGGWAAGVWRMRRATRPATTGRPVVAPTSRPVDEV